MCGAKKGGLDLKGVDVDKEAVIQGQVLRGEEPVGGAYVRLLDSTGEFTAEVPTSATGHFRFFAAPGTWTLRTLAPKAEPVDRQVVGAVRRGGRGGRSRLTPRVVCRPRRARSLRDGLLSGLLRATVLSTCAESPAAQGFRYCVRQMWVAGFHEWG